MAAWESAPLADAAPAAQPAWMAAPVEGLPSAAPSAKATPQQRGSRIRPQLASANPLDDATKAFVGGLGQGVGEVALGGQHWLGRGVRAVGGLFAPDAASEQQPPNAVQRAGKWLIDDAASGRARLASEAAQDWGGAEHPIASGAGRLAGNVVATLPVGGALAKGIELVTPASLASATAPLMQAARTAGMNTGLAPATAAGRAGDMAIRMAGGAINGGASAALTDPDSAATGAAVGALLPPGIKVASGAVKMGGRALGVTGGELRALFQSDATKGAQELMRALDLTPEQLPAAISQLRSARELVAGSEPTVAQVLSSPQSAILERVVSAGPGGEKLRQALLDQATARVAALRGVVPGAAGKTSVEAAENLGRTAVAEGGELRGWTKNAIGAKYSSDALKQAQLALPGKQAARGAVETFYPGVAFDEAPADLRRVISRLDSGAPVTFQEFDALRKLAGNRVRDLADSDRTASAAWGAVRGLFDDVEQRAIEAGRRLAPTGQGPFGPVYGGLSGDLASAVSPQAAQDLAAGRGMHREMVQRWNTGPWSTAWRTGSDGLPVAQGAELGRRFVNGGSSQLADLQSLKGGVLPRGPTMQAAREYALADLLDKSVNAKGELSVERLRGALDSRSLMLKELLDPQQLQQLKAVLEDAARAGEAAGRSKGPGSNTYQNAANALREGLLDSPLLQGALNRLPAGKYVAAGASGIAKAAGEKKAARLADLLADPAAAAAALSLQQRRPLGQAARSFMDLGDAGVDAAIPGLGGLSLRDLAQAGVYRVAPVAAANSNLPGTPR